MGNTIIKLFQKQNFVMNEDILKFIKKNNLTLNETLLITYFCNNNGHATLDTDVLKEKFGMNDDEALEAVESLSYKKMIEFKMKKNSDGMMEEIIDLSMFYEALASDVDEDKREHVRSDIYAIFEQEFGRPFSSMEFEIINRWLEKGINEGLIKSALKEAIFNGTMTLRYIDAILLEWTKKGFKSEKDVDIYLKKRKTVKEKPKAEDLFDYNWLEDE